MPRFACPACNAMFEVAADHLGMTVRCPSCGVALGTSRPGGAEPLWSPGSPASPGSPISSPAAGAQPGQGPSVSQPGYYPGPQQPAPVPGQHPYGYSPYGYPMPPQPGPNPAGVWSFVLGLAFWGIMVGAIAILMAGADVTSQEQAEALAEKLKTNPPAWAGPVSLVAMVVVLTGFVAGLYAVTRPNRRKGLAIAGLVLSSLGLFCGLVNFATGRG